MQRHSHFHPPPFLPAHLADLLLRLRLFHLVLPVLPVVPVVPVVLVALPVPQVLRKPFP